MSQATSKCDLLINSESRNAFLSIHTLRFPLATSLTLQTEIQSLNDVFKTARITLSLFVLLYRS